MSKYNTINIMLSLYFLQYVLADLHSHHQVVVQIHKEREREKKDFSTLQTINVIVGVPDYYSTYWNNNNNEMRKKIE